MSGETSYAVGARAVVGTETTTGVVGMSQRYVGPTGTALVGVQIDGEAPALGLGSPVVDDRGAVVGITTAVDEGSAWYVAPVEVVRKVADDLLIDGLRAHLLARHRGRRHPRRRRVHAHGGRRHRHRLGRAAAARPRPQGCGPATWWWRSTTNPSPACPTCWWRCGATRRATRSTSRSPATTAPASPCRSPWPSRRRREAVGGAMPPTLATSCRLGATGSVRSATSGGRRGPRRRRSPAVPHPPRPARSPGAGGG